MATTFRDFIYNCYHTRYSSTDTYFGGRHWDNTNISNSRPFIKYMRISLNTEVIEVPCIYKNIVMNTLLYNKNNPKDAIDTLYIPIMCLNEDSSEARTSNALLRKFLYETPLCFNLTKKRGSGTTYLGGEGLILYDDYTPMIMLTLALRKEESSGKYAPIKQIARINPLIYHKDDLLAKFIRTKFISGLIELTLTPEELRNLNEGFYVRSNRIRLRNTSRLLSSVIVDYKFKIIVDDFSDFFFTPEAPDVTFDSDKINEMLLIDPEFTKCIT